ncbi:class I SAM-dependent methyltransferase [Thalassospira povalilytica]|uniref:SAM-dependent methyltransferase n=2 Tax=Thalassospira TaxID=168934 RepID=A0ABX4R617_9PROT|nr:class I SAM-dependent methyltransferase [Thalassospira povalilytica]PKR47896.1 SAM-dependent methyltransferase [Thalassospira povalilytica]
MIIRKYTKSSSFYLGTKAGFFERNESNLNESLKENELYSKQPKREMCKICSSRLPGDEDFQSHNVSYVFCTDCGHLNGVFEDTIEFVDKIYMEDSGAEYAKNYLDEDFLNRVSDIYAPKVDFLLSVVPDGNCEILDVGCGAGYFVLASLMENQQASGIDVSDVMVNFGNQQILSHQGCAPLQKVKEDGFFEEVTKTGADVVSAIGVIEHLRQPHKLFEAFKESKAKYLYYSVPMFSLSVVCENVFKNVFPRQLSGGHTHLFTEKSISRMHELLGVRPVGEWRFGTDFMDLYRHLNIYLRANNVSQKMLDYFHAGFATKIDDLQAALDKNHFCSEIHVVAVKD